MHPRSYAALKRINNNIEGDDVMHFVVDLWRDLTNAYNSAKSDYEKDRSDSFSNGKSEGFRIAKNLIEKYRFKYGILWFGVGE